VLSLALGLFLSIVQGATVAAPVKITLDGRAMQPGELIVVTVESDQPSSVTGTVFDRELHFFSSGKPTVWQALVGLDVDLEPGEYPLDVAVRAESGAKICETRMLRISRRAFATRYLTLPEKYVNPPAAVQERIQRETAKLKAIFSTVTERIWDGPFSRPLPGKVISAFGKRSVLNGQPRSVHSGVDLRAPMGTLLKAPAGGRVILAQDLYFAGRSIILDHGLGLYSHFAHLSAYKVKEGQVVRRGEVIGLTGKSGRVQGPHLHWSVKLCSSRIDPMALLALLGVDNRNAVRERPVLSSRD